MRTGPAAVACGLGVHHLSRRIGRRRLLILCYHGVAAGPLPEGCPAWHHVDVSDFERQIRYIARHYDVLPIDRALDRLDNGSADRIACVTFDDGYRNNRSVALPVLREAGVPATAYLATGFVATSHVLWTVELEAAFRLSRVPEIELSALGLGARTLHTSSSRTAAAAEAIRRLKREGPARRRPLVSDLIDTLGPAPDGILEPFRMLDWSDVAAMDEEGLVSFGAHTVNHEIVSRLDDAELHSEIAGSVAEVGRRVKSISTTFAFPNGSPADFDERSRRVLEEVGARAALSTIEDLNDPAVDRFALRRIVVGRGMDFDRFRLATSGFLPHARRMRGER